MELHESAKKVKDEAEATNTEHAYTQMANTDRDAGDAWSLALEAKKTVLSKVAESEKAHLLAEMETAERRKEAYTKRAVVGLEKAKEISSLMKDIAMDKQIAEEAVAKAKKSDLAAIRVNGITSHDRDADKEMKAYRDSIEAWAETIEGYKIVVAKATKARIDCSEFTTALDDAEEKKGNWVRKLTARTLQSEAEEAGRIAEAASNKALAACVSAEKLSLWEAAQEKREQAEKLWGRTIEAYQDWLNQAPEALKDGYLAEIEAANNTKMYLSARWYYCEAFRVNSFLGVANEQARRMTQEACDNIKDPSLAIQAGRLLEEVKQKREEAIKVWNQAVAAYERMSAQVPDRFKSNWMTKLAEVANNKNLCAVRAYYDHAIKAQSSAFLAKSKALNGQSGQLWEEEKQARAQEEKAWSQAVEAHKEERDKAPLDCKDDWTLKLNLVIHEKAKCAALFYRNEAERVGMIAEEATKIAQNAEAWDKAKQARFQEGNAWGQVITVYESMRDQAPKDNKGYWDEELKNIAERRDLAAAKVYWCEAKRVGQLAIVAKAAAGAIKSKKDEAWGRAKYAAEQEEKAWSQAKEVYAQNSAAGFLRYEEGSREEELSKNSWDFEIQAIKENKNYATASVTLCDAFQKSFNPSMTTMLYVNRQAAADKALEAWKTASEAHKAWWNSQFNSAKDNFDLALRVYNGQIGFNFKSYQPRLF